MFESINLELQWPGFEPGLPPWQGDVLPLDYHCLFFVRYLISFYNIAAGAFYREVFGE